MREKLLELMKNEGLKPSQLAEMLEINPAGISHMLAGRNKPGFDLLQKILRRFPRISPDWLLLDTGRMYRSADATDSTGMTGMSGSANAVSGLRHDTSGSHTATTGSLGSGGKTTGIGNGTTADASTAGGYDPQASYGIQAGNLFSTQTARMPSSETTPRTHPDIAGLPSGYGASPGLGDFSHSGNNGLSSGTADNYVAAGHTSVKRVVVIYDDQTFETYTPAQRR